VERSTNCEELPTPSVIGLLFKHRESSPSPVRYRSSLNASGSHSPVPGRAVDDPRHAWIARYVPSSEAINHLDNLVSERHRPTSHQFDSSYITR